jgi:hypothetical protein
MLERGDAMDQLDTTESTGKASRPKRGGAAPELGHASVLWANLRVQLEEFQSELNEEAEVGALLASFGREVVITVLHVGYHDPSFFVFDGEDLRTGERVRLIQHTSQVSLLLRSVAKPAKLARGRRIGFHAAGDESEYDV